jgi:hypothetical protein
MSSWNDIISLLSRIQSPQVTLPSVPPGMFRNFAQEVAQGKAPAANEPLGTLLGVLHSLPSQYGNLGAVRPLGPGEYVARAGGGVSSEESITVGVDAQGNATSDKNAVRFMVLPSLWNVNGQPIRVSADQAAQYAKQSGLNWPTFLPASEAHPYKNADDWAQQREEKFEKPGTTSASQPSLWSFPK